MNNQSVDYQKLKFTVHAESGQQRKSRFVSKIAQTLSRIVESSIAVNELKIYSLRSRSGCGYWVIHEPLLGRRVFFNSETEVRQWLDDRYYK
jgi:hypothetical protein